MNRWEDFKPIIEQLYLQEKKKLADVVRILKNDYGFDALDHQYKHQFKKWKWKKSIPKSKKDEIAEQLESRARAGKPGTSITLQGRTVELHKIRRHMKTKTRADFQGMVLSKPRGLENIVTGPVLPFVNSIFLKWNIPYAAMRGMYAGPVNHNSPFGFSVPTPGSELAVDTPPAASPGNAPSPTTLLIKRKTAIDRAHLFVQGQHNKLLISMDREERQVMSDWLYQYWFFSFKTAKAWGRGPSAWTAELLDFARYHPQTLGSLPGTPQDPMSRSADQAADYPMPTSLCRWFIHIPKTEYEGLPEEEVSQDSIDQDPNDESTWLPWPEDWQEPSLPARLRNALEHNDFSSIPTATLPVAVPQIARAAERSPDELLLESLGFSIMSRNLAQVGSIMDQIEEKEIDFTSLYPLHIATSYMDGYKSCCSILTELLYCISGQRGREMYVNELGHSILDNLMISILKSHSAATPVDVDDTLKDTVRFMGEEIDICGRWDADSPCVRHLLTKGNASTPFSWKHKFCHTSIQTICHCIIKMKNSIPQLIETASGLYIRRCFDCGMKLQLQPLHSLVMTAYHLALSGCHGEDLFGILACLLCFISCGIDPRKTASVSVTAFMQTDASEIMCDHEELTPAELAEKISTYPVVGSWNAKVQSGWAVFCGVLRLCEDTQAKPENDGYDVTMEDDEDDEDFYNRHFIGTSNPEQYLREVHFEGHGSVYYFGTRRDLATLWASVQAELLSYRRLDDGMEWISPNFQMEQLQNQLRRGEYLSVRFAEQDLLQTHCICGKFGGYPLETLSDVTDPDIANLDIWERATYAVLPDE